MEYCVCGHIENKHFRSGCVLCASLSTKLIIRNEFTYFAKHEFKSIKERKLM